MQPFFERSVFMETVKISTEFIKLEQLLKWAGVTDSGAEAKTLIIEGNVRLNGIVEKQRGKKVRAGDIIEMQGIVLKVCGQD